MMEPKSLDNCSISNHTSSCTSKEVIISDDILHELIKFITRAELGQNFSLVNHRFHGFAHAKMHTDNGHWIEGECHLTVRNNGKSSMVVPRGHGGFESVSVPYVGPPPNVLGFRGKIHFNGFLSDALFGFFRSALPPQTTLYRFSWLDDFYKTNGLLSPLQTTDQLKRFLDECVLHSELGGDDAYVSAFLAMDSVRGRIRKLRATKFRELFIGWLHQADGEWRQLQIMRKINLQERNRLIKNSFQSLNDASVGVASASMRFCVKVMVRHWGEPVEHLPLRWLRNSRTDQCIVMVERRPPDNILVELCLIRCPYAEAQQRGFIDADATMDDLMNEFSWEEPLCTVDVVPNTQQHSDSDDNADVGGANVTPLHQFF